MQARIPGLIPFPSVDRIVPAANSGRSFISAVSAFPSQKTFCGVCSAHVGMPAPVNAYARTCAGVRVCSGAYSPGTGSCSRVQGSSLTV